MQGGYNLVPEKMLSGIKSDVFQFCSIPGGKYQMAMTCSILERKFLWRHISKNKKANNLKFRMFTGIIGTIIGQISNKSVDHNLVFWVWAKSPPVAGEISKCRRL